MFTYQHFLRKILLCKREVLNAAVLQSLIKSECITQVKLSQFTTYKVLHLQLRKAIRSDLVVRTGILDFRLAPVKGCSSITLLHSLSTNPDIPTQPVTTIKPSISKLAVLLPQSQIHKSKALPSPKPALLPTISNKLIQSYFLTLFSLTLCQIPQSQQLYTIHTPSLCSRGFSVHTAIWRGLSLAPQTSKS